MSEKDKKLAETYISMFKCVDSNTRIMIDFYENQYKFYLHQIELHKEHEPFKLFKNDHQKWQEHLEELEKSFNKAFDNFIWECKELEMLIDMKI